MTVMLNFTIAATVYIIISVKYMQVKHAAGTIWLK